MYVNYPNPSQIDDSFSITRCMQMTSPYVGVNRSLSVPVTGNAGNLHTSSACGHDVHNNRNMMLETRRLDMPHGLQPVRIPYKTQAQIQLDFQERVSLDTQDMICKLESTYVEISDVKVDMGIQFKDISDRLLDMEASINRLVTQENIVRGIQTPTLEDIVPATTMCGLRQLSDRFRDHPAVSFLLS